MTTIELFRDRLAEAGVVPVDRVFLSDFTNSDWTGEPEILITTDEISFEGHEFNRNALARSTIHVIYVSSDTRSNVEKVLRRLMPLGLKIFMEIGVLSCHAVRRSVENAMIEGAYSGTFFGTIDYSLIEVEVENGDSETNDNV